MPDSAEQLIVNRLAAAPSIHPSGANLFVQDWTLEPGDIVTVQSGEESYQVPIYSMNLKWNGTSMLEIQSTGNQKRNPLSALNEKKTNEFRSGRRGLAVQQEAEEAGRQQYEHYVEQTDAYRTEIYRVNGVRYDGDGNIIYQTDPETGEYILDGAGNKIPVYDENSDGSISGQVIQSAQRMATIIKQTGTVLEVFDKTHQYYEGDRVLYPDSNGNVYRFITDHNPGDWKGTGEHGDVEALGTLQSQIDHNTENFNIFYGEVDDRLGTIEGSTLWGNASELLAINGRIRVDSQTGRLIIEEGGGLYTERTTAGGTKVYSGIWDNGNLTAGAIVEKINNQSSEQEQTIYTIRADRINLDGYVTATTLDAFFIDVDNLFSTTGYFGGINVHSITTNGGSTGNDPGSITSDILYATSQLSIGHGAGSSGAAAGSFYYQGSEYTPKTVKKAGTVQDNIKLFGTGTDTEIDIGGSGILDASVANNVLTLTKSDGTTTVNFSKATALNTGSVEADGETKQAGWSSGMFTVIATQTNKNTSTNQYETNEVGRTTTSLTTPLGHWGDPTQSEDPNTYYQGISAVIGSSLSAVDTGKSIQVNATPRYNAGKNSVGLAPMSYTAFDGENYPSSQTIYTDTTGRTDASGTEDNLHRDITLSLDVDDSYVYMKHGSDVIARITNTGSGAAYSDGYTDGQDNAFASIKSIEIDEGSASYASSNLSVNITAVSQLSLIKQDETTAQSDGESETVAQTLPVAVTNVTISDSSIVYNNNRTYTIGGSGGNVNIGAVNNTGGANIPVDTNAYPFTPTEALNAVNVVKGSWTGEAEKSITFTTDAQSPNASAPKTLTLSTGQESWTWTTVEDASFYQKQVRVNESSDTNPILTENVDLPDISVYVEGPGQQQDSWWKTEGANANKYVVPASTANAYLTSDSSKQHSIGSGTGSEGIVVDPSQAIDYGKTLVYPSIEIAGWFWEPTGVKKLRNVVASYNPYNENMAHIEPLDLPTLSVDVTQTGATVYGTGYSDYMQEETSVTDTVLSSAHNITVSSVDAIPDGTTAEELSGDKFVLKYTKDGTDTAWAYYTIPAATGNGNITDIILKTPTKVSYDSTSEMLTVNLEVTGENITNAPYDDSVQLSVSSTEITLAKGSISSTSKDDYDNVYKGTYRIGYSSGGVVKIENVDTITASVASTPIALELAVPTATLTTAGLTNWNSNDHVYNYDLTASLAVDNTGNTLKRQVKGLTLIPTDAISYGQQTAINSLDVAKTNQTDYANSDAVQVSLESDAYYFVKIGDTAYKKFQALSGGGSPDRRAVFLDNITLTAPDNPEPGFNWQFTESSFAHYTDPVSVETDATKKTQVTIDASAIYQAGINAATVTGTVDVVKGEWEKHNSYAECTFSPSEGVGQEQKLTIRQSAVENTSSSIGRVNITDGNENVLSGYFFLSYNQSQQKVVLQHSTTSSTGGGTDLGSIIGSMLGRQVTTIATIPVSNPDTPVIQSDVADIVKNPVERVTYSENYKTAFIPAQALDDQGNVLLNDSFSVSVEDAWNDGHAKGVEEGSGIKIEQEKTVDVSQNNTTITVLPTYTGSDQYDVMGSVKVNVQVPTYEGISSASIIDQSESEKITWQKELGTKTLSSQYGQIEVTGNDGSTKRLVVDAHQVYQNGMNAGAGIQIKDEERKEVNTVQTNITITPTPVNGVNYEAMRKAIVYVNLPRIKDTEDVGDITVGSSSTTLNVTPTGGYGAMKKVTGTIKVNYSNPTISVNAYPGTKTGQDVIGAYTVSQNRYVAITASANGKSTTKYINLSKG